MKLINKVTNIQGFTPFKDVLCVNREGKIFSLPSFRCSFASNNKYQFFDNPFFDANNLNTLPEDMEFGGIYIENSSNDLFIPILSDIPLQSDFCRLLDYDELTLLKIVAENPMIAKELTDANFYRNEFVTFLKDVI